MRVLTLPQAKVSGESLIIRLLPIGFVGAGGDE